LRIDKKRYRSSSVVSHSGIRVEPLMVLLYRWMHCRGRTFGLTLTVSPGQLI